MKRTMRTVKKKKLPSFFNLNYILFSELVYHVQHIPFVSLSTIDLSNNLIVQNSSVLSLICWPSLTEVTLTANTISLNKNLSNFQSLKSILSVYNIKIKPL